MFTLLIHYNNYPVQREYGSLELAMAAAREALEQGHPVQLLPAVNPHEYDEAP